MDFPNTEWVTKVKPNINSVGVPLLLSHNGHLLGGRWFTLDQPLSAVPFENLFISSTDLGGGGGGGGGGNLEGGGYLEREGHLERKEGIT